MSYSVVKNGDYKIVEKDTSNVVYKTKDEREARQMCRSLNLGSGFQGITPDFFLAEFPRVY